MATLKCTTTDDQGLPIAGIHIQANIQDGRCFARSSDGGGYSDLALLGVEPGLEVQLVVIKEGFEVYSERITSPTEDTEVNIQLRPFVAGRLWYPSQFNRV